MINKILKSPLFYLILIVIIATGLRLFRLSDYFYYAHDNDLAAWMVKDIVKNGHLRLIGQETSTAGIFIGPFFYYLMIPFFLLTNLDPIGITYSGIILGIVTTLSFFYVFYSTHNKKVAFIATIIYATSQYLVFNDKEIVPTMFVYLWTVWYYFAIKKLLDGKKIGYIVSGILISFIWHINFALVLLLPLIPVAILMSGKKLNYRYILYGLLAIIPMSIPLLLFEFRHGFMQINALITSLTTTQSQVFTLSERFNRVLELSGKNLKSLLLPGIFEGASMYATIVGVIVLFLAIYKKIMDKKTGILIFSWILLYMLFFTFYSKILSEYYLNGMIVAWIVVFSILIGRLFEINNKTKILGALLMFMVVESNLEAIYLMPINKSGYLHRKEIVRLIDEDRQKQDYPCVSVSYITEVGNDLGYRFFFYLRDMHVGKPAGGAPVYSIVYPLSMVDKVDLEVGALGLIYPDYKKYSKGEIKKACSGENPNLFEPMFGYTE